MGDVYMFICISRLALICLGFDDRATELGKVYLVACSVVCFASFVVQGGGQLEREVWKGSTRRLGGM